MSDKAPDTEPMEEVGVLHFYFCFFILAAHPRSKDTQFWLACATAGEPCLGTLAALFRLNLVYAFYPSWIHNPLLSFFWVILLSLPTRLSRGVQDKQKLEARTAVLCPFVVS